MKAKVSQGKACKGTVQIKNSNGCLQLVFSYGGKRHYISTGFTDIPTNRKVVEMKARQIELDILSGHFDPTLAKYKPESLHSTVTPIFTPISKPKFNVGPSLVELWEKYTDFKRPSLSPSTIAKDFTNVSRCIDRNLPTKTLDGAVTIRDWLVANKSSSAAKRILTQLNACCEWAVKSQLIKLNPFEGMSTDIKIPKGSKEDGDINPFSIFERDQIIAAFQSNQNYKHYASLIEFLFYTGCRPSEAVALQWKHISKDFSSIRFEQAVVISQSGLTCKPGLKTQKRRIFPVNARLANFLKSIKTSKMTSEAKVFPSPEGKWIDVHNLAQRAWKTVLSTLSEIEYRKLYQTRHTFITLALDNKMDVKDVAKLVGNSPEIIYRHYAGQSKEIIVPDF